MQHEKLDTRLRVENAPHNTAIAANIVWNGLRERRGEGHDLVAAVPQQALVHVGGHLVALLALAGERLVQRPFLVHELVLAHFPLAEVDALREVLVGADRVELAPVVARLKNDNETRRTRGIRSDVC